MFKKILTSKWSRFLFSAVLIYMAFRKIDIIHLLGELRLVSPIYVVLLVAYSAVVLFIGGVRWSILVLGRPNWGDFFAFTRATYLGGFYALFFPSAAGGDLLKWISLLKRYPSLSKARLAGSVLVDRVIGLTAFGVMALIALLAGKILGYTFPDFLLWFFIAFNLGIVSFYLAVFLMDFEKLLGNFKVFKRILEVIDLLKNENKKKIVICFLISVVAEPVWLLSVWFYSLIFNAGINLLQVYIFMPVISLILVLPISVAGFGAREQLFLYFFSQLGISQEKILLVSTFGGIIGVLCSLLGGLMLIF